MATRQALAAGTLCAILLAACSGGVGGPGPLTAVGKEVENAQEVLGELDRTFRQAVSTESRANVPETARCYLLLLTERDVNTESAFCGPVRRFNTNEGEVWDQYGLQVSATADRSRLSFKDLVASSVAVPDITKLVRPDEEEAKPSDLALPPPPAPPAPNDLLLETTAPPASTFTPLTSEVTGIITTALRFDVVGVSQPEVLTVPEDAGLEEPVVGAPEGSVLNSYHIKVAAGAKHPNLDQELTSPGVPQTSTVNLVVDGVKRPLELDGSAEEGRPAAGDYYVTIVAPASGAQVALEVSMAGKAQTLDLATGTLNSPVSVADYRTTTVQELNVQTAAGTATAGDTTITYEPFLLESVFITGFDDSKGWAPRGKAWLSFVFDPGTGDVRTAEFADSVRYSKATVEIVTDDKGVKYDYVRGAGRGITTVYLVPDTFTTGTWTFSPQFEVFDLLGEKKGSAKGTTSTVKVNLPIDGQPGA